MGQKLLEYFILSKSGGILSHEQKYIALSKGTHEEMNGHFWYIL